MTELEALRACPLFQTLSERDLKEWLLPLCSTRTVGKGSYLIVPQQRLTHFGVLCSGHVQILHLYPDGASCIIDTLDPGWAFGLDLLFTHSRIAPYHALATASTRILWFPAELLLNHELLNEPTRLSVYQQALAQISQNNMRREYRLAILAQKGLRERILTYLTMQANRRHTGSFTIPFSRDELASFLCVNRSALSHELSLLQRDGIISFRKNQFTLHGWSHSDEREEAEPNA